MDGMVSFHLTRLWNNSFINNILLLIHLLTLAFRTGAEHNLRPQLINLVVASLNFKLGLPHRKTQRQRQEIPC